MPRPVLFDQRVIERINKVVDYAHKHPLSMDDLLDIINKQRKPPGDFEEHRVLIPVGVLCVYSEELQNPGTCKHLSIAVDTPGKLPSIEVAREILPLFGIHTELEKCQIKVHEFTPGHSAVNIIELPVKS